MGETFAYFLANGESTGGAFALVDEQGKRGMSVPLHRHSDDMESFYVSRARSRSSSATGLELAPARARSHTCPAEPCTGSGWSRRRLAT